MKSGLQNEQFIQRIKESGSLALRGKNASGVNVFSGSVDDDGVISGKLIRPKYNVSELLKSVDTEITELLPSQGPSTGSFVTRSLFEEQVQFTEELIDEVESLSSQISQLSSKVEELNSVSESLRIELDRFDLTNETLDRQLSSTQNSFANINLDLQRALQNSTQESIERVSLSARNDSLRQEVELLREQLFGRQAQISAGAQSSGTLFTVNSSPIIKPQEEPIRTSRQIERRGIFRDDIVRDIKWVNGETITLFNSSDNELTISVERQGKVGWIQPIEDKTLPVGETLSFKLKLNQEAFSSTLTRDAEGGLIFTATTGNGTVESVTLAAKLVKWD